MTLKSTFTKGPDDLPRPEDPDYLAAPGAKRTSYSFVVDNVEVDNIGGVHVPIKGRAVEILESSDGSRRVYTSLYSRTKVALGPPAPAPGLFTMTDLPEGAPVTHLGHRNSPKHYIFRGGKIVEADGSNAEFYDLSPAPVPGHSVAYLVAWILVPLIVVAGLYLIVSRRRARKPG